MFPLASRAWRVEASTGGAAARRHPTLTNTRHPILRILAVCVHPRSAPLPRAHTQLTRGTRPPHAVSPARLCCAARTCLPWPGRGEEPGNFTKFYEITSGTNSINWSSGYTMKIMKIMKWSCLNYIGCGPSSAKQRATAAQRNDLKCG